MKKTIYSKFNRIVSAMQGIITTRFIRLISSSTYQLYENISPKVGPLRGPITLWILYPRLRSLPGAIERCPSSREISVSNPSDV